jgi:hypothetical protein
LNPDVPYVACRWPYDSSNKSQWRSVAEQMALVHAPKTGKSIKCYPSDWGPHETNRTRCRYLTGAMEYLGITTDDVKSPSRSRRLES